MSLSMARISRKNDQPLRAILDQALQRLEGGSRKGSEEAWVGLFFVDLAMARAENQV